MKSRYALILQGPIVSQGFDCTKNINALCNNFGKLFNQVILSTWEKEYNENLIDITKGIEILVNSDPLKNKTRNIFPDNRLRQWVSTFNGMKKISSEITHVLKWRTDQYCDLELLLDDYENNLVIPKQFNGTFFRENFIQSIALFSGKPYAICDFALIGTKRDIFDFYKAQVDYQDIFLTKGSGWPEGDSTRKYLFSIKEYFEDLSYKDFFPNIPKSMNNCPLIKDARYKPETYALWQKSLESIFSVSSRKVSKNLTWRGEGISEVSFNEEWLFRDRWQDIRENYFESEIRHLLKSNFFQIPGNKHLLGRRIQAGNPKSIIGNLVSKIEIFCENPVKYTKKILRLIPPFSYYK
jgi:hypothetical protein